MKNIALVIRGKHSETHAPGLMEQHADVVLSTGEPMGFFGEGNGGLANYGLFMTGVVYDYNLMREQRPVYTDAELAKKYGVVSTLCMLEVSDEQAARFDAFWRNPPNDFRTFSLVGDNCSTAASLALRNAGILKAGIPGLDTPDNLYHQMKNRYGGRFSCKSGHVGFEKVGNRFIPIVK